MATSSGLKIALVGCGAWGKNILRDLVALGSAVYVVDRDADSRTRAGAVGATSTCSSVAELPLVDGAVVAVDTTAHVAVIDALFDRWPTLPTYCEKPLCDNAAEARRLAERAPRTLFVLEKWRYHHGVKALANIARSGELGRVLSLSTQRLSWGNKRPDDVDQIWTLAPHDLSIVREVLGRLPEPQWARADVVDGRPTHMVAVLGDQPWAHVELSSRHPSMVRSVRLHCERGLATLSDSYDGYVTVVHQPDGQSTAAPRTERRTIPTGLPLEAQLREFLGFIRGGPAPKASAAEGAETVATIAELRRLANVPETAAVVSAGANVR